MRFVLIISLLGTCSALADQSPIEQALSAKLVREFNEGLGCSATVIDLQRQLADTRKQIEELKKPKDDPK